MVGNYTTLDLYKEGKILNEKPTQSLIKASFVITLSSKLNYTVYKVKL